MSEHRTGSARDLFIAALERPLQARREFLDQACAGNAALYAEVMELLDAYNQTDDFLESGVTVAPTGMVGRQIGRYEIRRLIASGGMGSVYEAQQEQPSRAVALKLMKRGIASRSALRRFEYEAQLLGRLRHPNIAQVYEAGTCDDAGAPWSGVPYFAMEYIPQALPITEFATQHTLNMTQRLELFGQVCDAVYHGHQKGIIHRDLKPSNILVDAAGQPKIIDFGVARSTDSDIAITTMQTSVGQLIGTLQYMSPEQCQADPNDIDTRSDVYALGVVLYELLCDQLPYEVVGVPLHEATRIIREQDPSRLSTINKTVRGDVETIVLKALEKDRERRYRSAADLGEDIRRYLSGEAIHARPPSIAYQLRVFTRRHTALVGAVTSVFFVLIAATGVSISFALGESEQRALAENRQKETEQVAEFQESRLAGVDAEKMGQDIRHDILDKRRTALELAGRSQDDIENELLDLEQSLAGVNFTDVARESMELNIFEPTLQAIEERFAEQPLVQAQLLQSIAKVMTNLRMLDRATAPQQQALHIRQRELGDTHIDTLRSISATGDLLYAQARIEEAGLYRRQALESARQELGDEHPFTLQMMNKLGVLMYWRGKYAESIEYYSEALEIARRVLGEEDWLVLTLEKNTAWSLAPMGQRDKAVELLRDSLQRHRRVLGNDDQHTLGTARMLGGLLRSKGRLEEAEPLYREILEGYRRMYGDEHSETLFAMNALGLLLSEQGAHEEAQRLAAETVRRGRHTQLGERPQGAAYFLANHARSLTALARFEEAEAELLEAQALIEDADVPIRASDLFRDYAFGLTEDFVNLYDGWHAAEPAVGYDAKRAVWREKLELMINLEENNAFALGLLDAQAAHKRYRKTLRRRRRVPGNEDRSMHWVAERVGVSLRAHGKLEEAQPYLREVLESSRRIKGDEHPETLVALFQLSKLLSQMDEHEEAERLAGQAVLYGQEVLTGARPYGAALFLARHAMTLRALKRFEAAEAGLLEAQALFEDPDVPLRGPNLFLKFTTGLAEELADLYDAWHAVEPMAGYNAKAAQWRGKLGQLQTNPADTDGDGVVDAADPCPNSDLGDVVVIDGCDTGVANLMVDDNGCKMNDLIAQCVENAADQSEFTSCVAGLTDRWTGDGYIKPSDSGQIQGCAAQAEIRDWGTVRFQQLVEEYSRQKLDW